MSTYASGFAELAWACRFAPSKVVGVIYCYVDESGEHDSNGNLLKLTVAGGIASADAWGKMSTEWAAALSTHRLRSFHMVDFEARQGDFKDMKDNERKDLLNGLLDAGLKNIPDYYGCVADVPQGRPREAFRTCYGTAVGGIIREWAIRHRLGLSEKVRLVCAAHQNISCKLIGECFDIWHKNGDPIEFGGFLGPDSVEPLQLADIVAYELSRHMRVNRPEPDRYPFKRIKDEAKSFTLKL